MRTNNNNHIGNERAAAKKNNWIIAVTGNRKTSTTQTTKWNENKEERISNRISFFSLPRLLEHSAHTMWICSMRKIAKVLRNSTNLLNTSMKSLCCARCFVGCFFLSPVVVVIAVVVVVFYFAASLFFFPCSIYTTYATHFYAVAVIYIFKFKLCCMQFLHSNKKEETEYVQKRKIKRHGLVEIKTQILE